jgi:hypothetical protein
MPLLALGAAPEGVGDVVGEGLHRSRSTVVGRARAPAEEAGDQSTGDDEDTHAIKMNH